MVMKKHALLTLLAIGLSGFCSAGDPPAGASAPAALPVRVDRVNHEWRSADPGEPANYIRETRLEEDGLFHVSIRSSIGVVRVRGCYTDSALTVPHGRFVFAHPNGRIACIGEYVHGVKSGTWKRFDANGHPLAERVYRGESVEQMLDAFGVVSVAQAVAGAAPASSRAPRRFTRAMEF